MHFSVSSVFATKMCQAKNMHPLLSMHVHSAINISGFPKSNYFADNDAKHDKFWQIPILFAAAR